jgi:hypothetical protein
MVYLRLVDQSTDVDYSVFRVAGLYITRTIFAPGMWQTMNFPEDVRFCDLASKHFQPAGVFANTDGILPDRMPGWMSCDDKLLVKAGSYRRQALTLTEVWCVSSDGRASDTSHVTVRRLGPGQSTPLTPGSNLFVARGSCSAGGERLSPGRLYEVESAGLSVQAEAETYVLLWRRGANNTLANKQ